MALVQHLDMNRVLSAGSTSWWPCSSMRISLSTVIFSIFRPCHPIITLVLKTFIFTEQFWVRLAIYTHVSDDLHHSRCDFHLRSNFIQEHLPEYCSLGSTVNIYLSTTSRKCLEHTDLLELAILLAVFSADTSSTRASLWRSDYFRPSRRCSNTGISSNVDTDRYC